MYRLQLRNQRLKQRLSLRELSELTGIARSTLSEIENKRSSPTLTTINKLSRVLGHEILAWKEDKHGHTTDRD